MNIKEVEQLLGITRANIRYYEKEGLFSVERKENKYRDYSDKEIAVLKKIIVLRKVGVSVEEIRDLFDGKAEFSYVMENASSRLEKELQELKGALKVSQKLKNENADSFDEDYYFDYITDEESRGNKFIDLCKDILKTELDIFDATMKHFFRWDFREDRKQVGVIYAIGWLVLFFFGRGLVGRLWGDSFWEVFLSPLIVFLLVSAILLPIYLLSRKYPKPARALAKIIWWVGVIFLTVIGLILIIGGIGCAIDKII